jgi:4-hydroxy-tetrahydrodipicolinate synthase
MYRGVVVPLVTPVSADGTVSEPDVARLIETVRAHVTALLPALSTGEGWALNPSQWHDMVSYTVRNADGLPVLAGVQCATTAEVIARAALAAELGAQAVVVPTPFGSGLSQGEMYEHYEAVHEATSLPMVVYNESAVSANTIKLTTLQRICALPGVVAVKESSGDVEFTRRLMAANPGVAVWQGREHLLLPSNGVDGYVLSLANVEPALCKAMFEAPSAELAAQIDKACQAYQLDGAEWYRQLKSKLRERKVILSARCVAP